MPASSSRMTGQQSQPRITARARRSVLFHNARRIWCRARQTRRESSNAASGANASTGVTVSGSAPPRSGATIAARESSPPGRRSRTARLPLRAAVPARRGRDQCTLPRCRPQCRPARTRDERRRVLLQAPSIDGAVRVRSRDASAAALSADALASIVANRSADEPVNPGGPRYADAARCCDLRRQPLSHRSALHATASVEVAPARREPRAP